jgi:multisubunit Na+/H+ antiporter MnhE subunit
MSFWVILDDSVETDELLAGAGAAALGAFLAEFVLYQTGTRFRVRPAWVVPALRLPALVVRDTWIVFRALWRLLARGEPAAGGFREVPVRYGGDSAQDVTRRVLLTGGRSFTPNAFVLGLDRARDVMVVHELVRPGGPESAHGREGEGQ